MGKQHIQYGCGLTAPSEWENFDVSPTLRLQRIPVLNLLLQKQGKVRFPANVKYGDIRIGLPGIKANSCKAVYCSHVLEHLSLEDCRIALKNTYELLVYEGIFRLVVPDLEQAAKTYLTRLATQDPTASLDFIGSQTLLGLERRPKGLKEMLIASFGNSKHLWMWDYYAMEFELKLAGFRFIRKCEFNDSSDPLFQLVEEESRFQGCLAIEAIK